MPNVEFLKRVGYSDINTLQDDDSAFFYEAGFMIDADPIIALIIQTTDLTSCLRSAHWDLFQPSHLPSRVPDVTRICRGPSPETAGHALNLNPN